MVILLIVLLTTFAVWEILKLFGVFEFSRGQSYVVSDIKTERKNNKKRKKEVAKLNFYASIIEAFRGILLSSYTYDKYRYFIERLDIRSRYLDRLLTPEEYKGKSTLQLFFGIICGVLGFTYHWIFFAGALFGLYKFTTLGAKCKSRVEREDRIIDENFLNLYLLMYSKLRQGSRARLKSVVESYSSALESEQDPEVKRVMLKLSEFLLNNLMLYEDHVAVPKLKERYKSATMVNFCNVATQALQGVDNDENLLTFRLSLVRRTKEVMTARADKLCKQCNRAEIIIWILLFFLVGVSFYSKIPFEYFWG